MRCLVLFIELRTDCAHEMAMATVSDVTLVQRYSVNPWPRWMGVMHGDEIMFVFGEALKRLTPHNYSLEDRQLSQQMMTYWTNFAKTRSVHRSVCNQQFLAHFDVSSEIQLAF